jgi:hypothetical protein
MQSVKQQTPTPVKYLDEQGDALNMACDGRFVGLQLGQLAR